MFKRIMSVMLAVVMILSLAVVAVSAETSDKLYIRVNNETLYEVEQGQTYTYVYSLACDKKVCSLDCTTYFDAAGLKFVPDVDEYGDFTGAEYPNIGTVYNHGLDGQVLYNYSNVSGFRFPVAETMTEKNVVFQGKFEVTAESGIYNIYTDLKVLGDNQNNKIYFDSIKVDETVVVNVSEAIDGLTPADPSDEPSSEEPSSSEEPTNPSYVKYGDVNLDFKVNVIDATDIQRYKAQIIEIYDEQIINADVDADGAVSVMDATEIQRWVAKIITEFPADKKTKDVASTSAGDVATLLKTAKSELSVYYQYSSFDQYMALKKVVKELEKSGDKSQTAYNKLNAAYTGFHDILDAIGVATSDTIDVYFTNIPNWSTVNAYVWGSSPKTSWPGEAMTYVKTNAQGQKIYKITLETGKYTNIIFNNGTTQTVDLSLSNTNNEGFYTTTMSGGKYLCDTYTYS